MARFIRLDGVQLTNTAAPKLPHSLGVPGFNHRWSPTLLQDALNTDIVTLPDLIGTHTLTSPGGGTTRLLKQDAAGFRYVEIGNTINAAFKSAAADLLPDKISVAMVIKYPAGYATTLRVGGYAIQQGGNGRWQLYSYAATTGSVDSGVSAGTGWTVIVASLDGAATRWNINGQLLTAPGTLATPTTFAPTQIGSSPNPLQVAEVATIPRILTDAERVTVTNTLKLHYGIA